MDNSAPESPEHFYRKELPDECIEFSSNEGKQIFKEALSEGYLDCYFRLAAQFRTQDEPAFCGLSTLVMVLNGLAVDPGRVWKNPWRWYDERMLDCCMPFSEVEKQGITFDGFICLAECNCLVTKARRAKESLSDEEFREVVKQITTQEETVLVASYFRPALGQSGEGHFSPIAGYHPGRDLVLILDTARFKYPPHWVKLSSLVNAMKCIDEETGKPRGYVLLSRQPKSTPFSMSGTSQLRNVIVGKGLSPEIKLVINSFIKWLSEPACPGPLDGIIIRQAVLKLIQLASVILEPTSIVSPKGKTECTVSPEHLCSIKQLMESVQTMDIFNLVSEVVIEQQTAGNLDIALKAFEATHKQTKTLPYCELARFLTPAHFYSALLLSLPYGLNSKSEPSNAGALHKLFGRCNKASFIDVTALDQQLRIFSNCITPNVSMLINHKI